MKMRALVVTDGFLQESTGKTAHGLITGISRYHIVGVIDHKHAGCDAGFVVDGKTRDLPIFSTIGEAFESLREKPTHCVVGIATSGGRITPTLQETLKSAIEYRLIVVNGLHDLVNEHPILAPLLDKYSISAIDIRKPKQARDLIMWSGKSRDLSVARIAVLGMDCASGKRTTCQMLYTQCRAASINAEMIYTGQTGWLQGFRYGFILDSTLNDFVAGELEHAVVTCAHEAKPDVIFIEGQSSLRNPSGPCGAEYICSVGAQGVILQYPVGRTYYSHQEDIGSRLPSLESEIALLQFYGAKILGITLNTKDLVDETWQHAKQRIAQETGVVTVCPREEGVDGLIPVVTAYMRHEQSKGSL